MFAHNLQDVLEGIGCLIGSDDQRGHGQPPCGTFQSPVDASALMFFAAQSVGNIRALMAVGDAASYRLRNTKAAKTA